jgi:hypothetical protein
MMGQRPVECQDSAVSKTLPRSGRRVVTRAWVLNGRTAR